MSRISYWFCAALIVATSVLYYPKWEQPHTEATLSWDVSGYYLYLPAALIYKDLKQLNWWGGIEQKYNPGPGMGGAFRHSSGNYVMKYPMGQALQFLPWFAAAHALAEPLGYPADGFSLPYQAAVSWGSLLVALFGLWFLRKVLRTYFSDKVVAATLLCLVFGTNYLEYASISGAMTHNLLFTLYALLVFSTIRFYQKPSFAWAAAIGLLVGWAALTRPTEIISALIPLLWGVTVGRTFQPATHTASANWKVRSTVRERLLFFKNHFSKIALAATVAGAVIFLQFAYWKYATGEWFVYSYQEQGFSWLHPHLTDVLFSARAGWLIYSPMVIFAVVGMFFLRHNPTPRLRSFGGQAGPSPKKEGGGVGRGGKVKNLLPAILIYCLLAFYITAAWDIWWYGGSLGQRAMVQSYPLWAFGLAAFITWASGQHWRSWVFVPLAGACIYLNLWWTHQAHRGGLFVSEQMTKRYMLKILGRFEAERDWLKMLDTKEEFKGAERRNVREIYADDFENDTTSVTPEAPVVGAKSLILNKEKQFSPEYALPVKAGEGDWLRASVTFRCDPKEWDWWLMTQFVVRFYAGDKIVKERMIRLQRHVDGYEAKTIFFDTKILAEPFDRATVLFWNAGGNKTISLDDLRVEVFE